MQHAYIEPFNEYMNVSTRKLVHIKDEYMEPFNYGATFSLKGTFSCA